MREGNIIAQEDDPELLEWLVKANQDGGGFVSAIARAALIADWENYPLIRAVDSSAARQVSAIRAERCGES